jgi:uncharacterized protein (TIGR03083 family)
VSKYEAYAETRGSLLELLKTLSEDQLATPVPATPGWSVLDVVSHLTGVARSFATGKFEGASGPAWTDGHVSTRRGRSPAENIEEWDGYLPAVEEAINASAAGAMVNDIWCHEQDIRGTLKLPGNRDAVAGELCVKSVRAVPSQVEGSGLAVPTVVVDGVTMVEGAGPTLTLEGYEASRMIFGRRSAAQISAMNWSEDPGDLVNNITIFGPSAVDIFDD